MRAITYFNRGNSFPIVLEHERKKFLVKLREGMSGQYGLLSEWLGNEMGRRLGLPTQTPHWVDLQEVEMEGMHEEVRDLIRKSEGINIGFPFLEGASEIRGEALEKLEKNRFREVFLLDLLLLNIDRSPSNPNLLQSQEETYSIDYESSMLFNEVLGGSDVLANPRILECLKANPLYQQVSLTSINEFLEKVDEIDFESMLEEVPTAVLDQESRKTLLAGIEERQKKRWRLEEILEKTGPLVLATEAERKKKANENQARFKRNMEEFGL